MRAAAQIDEITLLVERQRFVAWDVFNDLCFVLFTLVAKERDRLVALPDLTFYGFVPVDDFFHSRLDDSEVILGEGLLAREVVIKAVFDRWADGDLGLRPQLFDRFGHYMCSVVAKQFEPIVRLAGDDFHGDIGLDIPGQVQQLAIHANGHRIAQEALADRFGDL